MPNGTLFSERAIRPVSGWHSCRQTSSVNAVKPTKTNSSVIELENIDLFSTGGYVFDGNVMKSFQNKMNHLNPKNLQGGVARVLNLLSNSVDLKKDMEELKTEIAELKKLIKELVDKK